MKSQATYSTAQVAQAIGVSKRTLLRWLEDGKVPEPKKRHEIGGVGYRAWNQAELQTAKTFRDANYRKRS